MCWISMFPNLKQRIDLSSSLKRAYFKVYRSNLALETIYEGNLGYTGAYWKAIKSPWLLSFFIKHTQIGIFGMERALE